MRKIFVTFTLVLVFMSLLCGCSNSRYQEAESLLSEGDFEAARSIYQDLEEEGGYKDSKEKILECNYLEATAAYNSNDYIHAYDLFSSLSQYKDSSERSVEVGYALANQLAANENYIEAAKLFSSFGDYEKSEELAAECSSRVLLDAAVGDIVLCGTYEQDGNIDNGTEPIEWIVLEKSEDNVLLLSKYILEEQRFDESTYHWEDCELREWLNDVFYDAAFSEAEKKNIQNMITSKNTEDNVFCLSAAEVRGLFPNQDDRQAYPTKYLIENGFNTWEDFGRWWTRSVSTAKNGKGVVPVTASGEVRSAGTVPYDDEGVRPAICLNISGKTSSQPQNMNLFGFDSSGGLDNEPNKWGSGSSNSNGSGGKCAMCNGTGYVKYYYGSSDLEAWLSGHDAYTVGECSRCNGTGKD